MNSKSLALLFLICTAKAVSLMRDEEEDNSIRGVYSINNDDSRIINGLKPKKSDNAHIVAAIEDLTNTHTAKRSNEVNHANLNSNVLFGVSEPRRCSFKHLS